MQCSGNRLFTRSLMKFHTDMTLVQSVSLREGGVPLVSPLVNLVKSVQIVNQQMSLALSPCILIPRRISLDFESWSKGQLEGKRQRVLSIENIMDFP